MPNSRAWKRLEPLETIWTLRQEFITIWSTWIGDKLVGLWSCALLTEALEVVSSKAWKGLMELGTQSPCPPPGPPLGNANAA